MTQAYSDGLSKGDVLLYSVFGEQEAEWGDRPTDCLIHCELTQGRFAELFGFAAPLRDEVLRCSIEARNDPQPYLSLEIYDTKSNVAMQMGFFSFVPERLTELYQYMRSS